MTTKNIVKLAKQWKTDGKSWHFHILTPECLLNQTKKYVLLIENTTDNQNEQMLSDVPYMDIGEELVKLLHGDKILNSESGTIQEPPSKPISEMLEKAKELSTKHLFWHHHMLFPECRFNSHQGKWVILFEDPEQNKVIESITEEEPLSDLQYLEHVFYQQRETAK